MFFVFVFSNWEPETQKGDTCVDSVKRVYLEVETGSELRALSNRTPLWSLVVASFLLSALSSVV